MISGPYVQAEVMQKRICSSCIGIRSGGNRNIRLNRRFDPGPGTWEQTSAGFYDIYLVQYDFDGALIEAGNMGSPYSDYGHVLTMAPNGDILTGGRMQSPLDIDPGPGEILLYGNTGFDGYIARYNTCISYFLEESATICAGETYDFHGTVLSEAGEYVALIHHR